MIALVAMLSDCERGADSSGALIGARRAAWEREVRALREQQSTLVTRFERKGLSSSGLPAERRVRVAIDGARQSISDVENQLERAGARMEAAHRGGHAVEHSIDEESARARDYLRALADQLLDASKQLDDVGRGDNRAKDGSP